jgi:two-component system, NarL family, sensor histidine kinase NreB
MLPLKHRSRATIVKVGQMLQPHFPEITQAWRRKMADEFAFDDRVLSVLERLTLGIGYKLFHHGNFAPFFENLNYFGTRLAKLQVDARAVARAIEFGQELCEPYLEHLSAEERAEARAALETLSSATFVTVSGAYFDAQKKESQALLAVLDAELSAGDLSALLSRVLHITGTTFNASVGLVLLRDVEGDLLRVGAAVGFDEGELDAELAIRFGQGFSGTIAQTGEPGILPDLAESQGGLNPILRTRAKSLWGVPLKAADRVIGVLLIGFIKPYEWLPTERELLRAIAERSALAIDKARIHDALREREARIAELSAHLLKVQEDERKRISRELHDETGQALMVIRLYLGMLEQATAARTAKAKIRETVGVVDRTVEGLRRIIGRLSPLVLQELGLIAAIRKEAKDLAKSTGVKARVLIPDDFGRLNPEVEAALYRVVQEALHNVAKHAQAKTATIHMERLDDQVHLLVEDDGVGASLAKPKANERQTFGLTGIRERIGMLRGTVKITSAKGRGTKLDITVPIGEESSGTILSMPGVETTSLAATGTGRLSS